MPNLLIEDFVDVAPPETIYSGRQLELNAKLKEKSISFHNRETNCNAVFTGKIHYKGLKKHKDWAGTWQPWKTDKTWEEDIRFTIQGGERHTISVKGYKTSSSKKAYRRYANLVVYLDTVAGTDPKTGEEYTSSAEPDPEITPEFFWQMYGDWVLMFIVIIIIMVVLAVIGKAAGWW